MRIIKLYNKALQVHPWKTQSITTGFLMGTSDVVAQTLVERRKMEDVELPRIARFAALGTFFVAPVIRSWYIVLERTFGAVGKTVGLKKMLFDQLMFTPCFIGSFLTVFNTSQFQPWHVIKAKVKQDYFTILKSNYKLWPAVQLISFYIIPFHLRLVFVSVVALFWNTYLAYVANRKIQ